ncbi:MAG: hypothetical protein R3C55_13620 [Parvularculaceae bacterium]
MTRPENRSRGHWTAKITRPALARLRLTTGVILASSLFATASFADQASNARLLASQCAQCHGTNGRSVGGIDSLAGEEYFDLLDKLIDMSRPGETGGIMKHQARYTRDQMKLIAQYYSSLPKSD